MIPGGKNIENFFGLPPLEEVMGINTLSDEHAEAQAAKEAERNAEEIGASLDAAQTAAEQSRKQMAMYEGADHGVAMDHIHRDVKKHAVDLMDLAFNADMRATARIAEVAAQMFKIAIDAKNSKREMQLKGMKLSLDKQKLDLDRLRLGDTQAQVGQEVQAEGVVIEDRNELIRRAREQIKRGQ